ncbi:hypothetical protein GGR54DRAFT_499912 [Hypoxylon sp. NC1633]|nr:hypothetical protein GGR54DRAFT_499912 [Hypoxylon sp. NC1633]
MYPSQQSQHPDDLTYPEHQQWRSDLPHHVLQPGAVPGSTSVDPSYGRPPPPPPPPSLGSHGLDNLASAAAISNPYHVSRATPSDQTVPGQGGPSAFIGSSALASGPPTAAAQQREQIRARRRVPSSQRKRTQVSCDACKTRRCKCVRLKASTESDIDISRAGGLAVCKLCLETGIPCVTTMPRKQRVYGSVENLDRRYRALEALVSGLFPDLNPRASAEELVAFGRERAISMPELGESPDRPRPPSSEPTIKPEPSESPPEGTVQTKGRRSTNLIIAATDHDKTILPPSYLMRGAQGTTAQVSPGMGTERSAEPNAERTSLILDATGRAHYIGPCGSLAFFARMRDLFLQRADVTRRNPGGLEHMGQGSLSGDEARRFINNPLAASLGGTGDGGRNGGSSSGPSGHVLDHLEGDTPPQICEDMLRDHPDGTEFWRYRKRVSTIDLPSRDRADACLEAFFRSVHPNFTLFHRLTFQSAYEKMWRCWEGRRNHDDGVKEISVSVGWLCCLYMMFILGSRALRQNSDSFEFQRKWFAKVDRLPPLLGSSSLPNVCAYMLLSLYYHNTNDRTSAWTFHGAACRLAIALGMHREGASGLFDPLERQLRKIVWWTLYGYEQFLCCSLGRPSAIDDREMDVGIPNDDYLDANLLPPRFIEHSAQLNMLLAAVRRGIFDPKFVPGRMYARALEFLETVAGWDETLPGGLRPAAVKTGLGGNDDQWRSAMLLNIQYHHTLGFLTRPFLFEAIQSANGEHSLGPDADKIRALSKVCLTAAMRCGDLIIRLWRAGQVNGVTWIDLYYAYMSSSDISLALFSPHSLCQDEEHSEVRNPRLIQKHTVEEMKDVVHQLCDVMSTIEVCGTNARFAKVAFEFANALGIISLEETLSLGMPVPDARAVSGDKESNEGNRNAGMREDQGFCGDHRQGTDIGRLSQSITGIPGYDFNGGMNLDFQETLAYPPTDTMGDVQWDM